MVVTFAIYTVTPACGVDERHMWLRPSIGANHSNSSAKIDAAHPLAHALQVNDVVGAVVLFNILVDCLPPGNERLHQLPNMMLCQQANALQGSLIAQVRCDSGKEVILHQVGQ